MTTKPLHRGFQWLYRGIRHRTGRRVLLGIGCLLPVLLFSCVNVNRVLVAPPTIPGATVVGNETCSQCHEPITKHFDTATHVELRYEGDEGEEAMNVGCESCHGPGSIHAESGGAYHTIINPKRSPDVCFRCHTDKHGEFRLPYAHAVLENQLSCGDCHDPHQGSAIKNESTALHRPNETCTSCHPAQRGPYVFEHEAMREGCTICHDPHGSVNAKMLNERGPNLCLKCHFQVMGSGLTVGGLPHRFLLQQGTCWTAGCHEAVHGSHVSTSLRF